MGGSGAPGAAGPQGPIPLVFYSGSSWGPTPSYPVIFVSVGYPNAPDPGGVDSSVWLQEVPQ